MRENFAETFNFGRDLLPITPPARAGSEALLNVRADQASDIIAKLDGMVVAGPPLAIGGMTIKKLKAMGIVGLFRLPDDENNRDKQARAQES